MRQIYLFEYEPPKWRINDNKGIYYFVKLGNGTVHKFESKRATTQFLTEASKFCTLKMFEINNCLGLLYSEYRRIWPYLYDVKADNKLLNRIDKDIYKNVRDAEDFLRILEGKAGQPGGYYIDVWRYMTMCYQCIIPALQAVVDFYQHRKQRGEYHQFTIHLTTMQKSYLEFMEYGKGRSNVEFRE